MKPSRLIPLLAFPAILLVITTILGSRPYYNWDFFPYMAIAISDPDVSIEETHKNVYQTAQSTLLTDDFARVSQRQPGLMNDPNAFGSILKYYQIKPGYNLFVSMLHGLGFNLVTATYLPSLISYFILGCLLFWWLSRLSSPLPAGAGTLAIMMIPLMTDLARYSSPDMMCTLLSIAGLILLFESFSLAGLSMLLVAIFIRPDAVILLLLVCVALAISKRTTWIQSITLGVLGISLTILVVKDLDLLKEFILPSVSFGSGGNTSFADNYFIGLVEGLGSVLHSYTLPFLAWGALALILRHRAGYNMSTDFLSLMALAAGSVMAVRYLLHPVVEDRFNVTIYFLLLAVSLKFLIEKLSSSQPHT